MSLLSLAFASLLALGVPSDGAAIGPDLRMDALEFALPTSRQGEGSPYLHAAADTLPGMVDGRNAAQEVSTRGAFVRGMLWGTVAGPAGGIIAMRREVGREPPPPPIAAETLRARGEGYEVGFTQGFADAHLARRRESSVLGSMVGTIAFLGILIAIVDLGQTEQVAIPPPSDGGEEFRGASGWTVSFPLGSFRW